MTLEQRPPQPSAAFTGAIQKSRVSVFYQIGLTVVACAMVLLPLIYVTLIVAVIKVVWWHLSNNFSIFSEVTDAGRSPNSHEAMFAALLYVGPAVAGFIFVFFLLKPLFSSYPVPVRHLILQESAEPELFSFVRKICELVGSPFPQEIRLDCRVNASAAFRRGWWSLGSDDLVLIIGLPLVAGMSMRQVAGVLAHEFGHFAQGAGMRLSFVIRSVNAWFARVVYERDSWDVRLDTWLANIDPRIDLVLKLAKAIVWVGRRILWCLMQVGHAISCFMSRQMEFDADSYEAKIAGSDEFVRTAARLRFLNAAQAIAFNDAQTTWHNHELPENLPALVIWREAAIPADVRQKIDASVSEEKTHWAQTHPCDRERMSAAVALATPGVFHLDEPAAGLFSDFEASCKAVTRHFYEHDEKLDLTKVTFRSSATMSEDRTSAAEAYRNLEHFFGATFSVNRVLPLPLTPSEGWGGAFAAMRDGADTYAHQLIRREELAQKELNQAVGLDLLRAKFTLASPMEFDLKSSFENEANATLSETHSLLLAEESAMESGEKAITNRLMAALGWLNTRTDQADFARERLTLLLRVQRKLGASQEEFAILRRTSASLKVMLSNEHNDPATLQRHISDFASRCEMSATRIVQALGNIPHPYLSAKTTIRESLRVAEPSDNQLTRAFKSVALSEDVLVPLLIRVMGDLCGLALGAEEAFKEAPPALSESIPPQPPISKIVGPPYGIGSLPPPSL